MSEGLEKPTNALTLAEAVQRIQMLEALVGQQRGELQELEAVLWRVLDHEIECDCGFLDKATDLLRGKRLDPEARERLMAEYQVWRAKEAANG